MKTLITITLLLITPGLLSAQQTKQTNVAILLYPGVELLDFAGPLEVFSLMPNATVYTVAATAGPLQTMKKMLTVTPDYTTANAPQPDVLVIPGAGSDPYSGRYWRQRNYEVGSGNNGQPAAHDVGLYGGLRPW